MHHTHHTHIHIYIYLLYENLLLPPQGRHASVPRKEGRMKDMGEERRKGKGLRHRGQTPKPILGIDAHIGDEEQNEKQNKEKERNREWVPNSATQDLYIYIYIYIYTRT